MIKRGISGIILCFFCYVNFFHSIVLAQSGDEITENNIENQKIEQNVQVEDIGEGEYIKNLGEEIEISVEDDGEMTQEISEIIEPENNQGDENEDRNEGNPEQNQGPQQDIEVPNIFIDFQNPSYILDKNIQKEQYICDEQKEECKINIKILADETEEISSDFSCEILFFTGETHNDCNPNTVIFPEGEHIISIKVFEKDNGENFIIKNISIINNTEEPIDDISEPTDPDSGSGSDNPVDEIPDDTGSGSDIIFEFPEIFLEIQSGLSLHENNIYICDDYECRTNLNVTESFTGSFDIGDYQCHWSFGSGSFSTVGTDEKCNPGYVIFPEGEHEIFLKILEKENEENFVEYTYIIKNIFNIPDEEPIDDISEPTEPDSGSGSDTPVDEIPDDNGTGDEPVFLEIPEIYIEVQSGGNLSGNTISCDKNECNLNLNAEQIFAEYNLSDYECEWDFGGGNFSTPNTNKKCNPGYVKYINGTFEISLKIIQKNNIENFKLKNYTISNPQKSTNNTGGSGGGNSRPVQKEKQYDTEIKQIIIQSGLENNICNDEKCKINLDFDNASYEECLWHFGEYENREKYTHTCNPRNVYFPVGTHHIQLSVTNTHTNNIYQKHLIFTNMYTPQVPQDEYNFEIELQGKQTDFKKYVGNEIICLGVEKCSINLKIQHSSKYEYFWDMGNGEVIQKSNPKSIWYDMGNYHGNVKILQNGNEIFYQDFIIYVIPAEQKEDNNHLIAKIQNYEAKEKSFFISKNINFSEVKKMKYLSQDILIKNIESEVNSSWKKVKKNVIQNYEKISFFEEKQKEKNISLKLTRNVSQQKKALKFSGETFPNAQIFIDNGIELLELQSDEQGKYEWKKQDFLQEGVYFLDYYVIDQNGNYFASKKQKILELDSDYIREFNQRLLAKKEDEKIIVKKKKIQKDIKNNEKTLEYDENKVSDYGNIQQASIQLPKTMMERYMQIFIILSSVIFLGLFWKKYKW